MYNLYVQTTFLRPHFEQHLLSIAAHALHGFECILSDARVERHTKIVAPRSRLMSPSLSITALSACLVKKPGLLDFATVFLATATT